MDAVTASPPAAPLNADHILSSFVGALAWGALMAGVLFMTLVSAAFVDTTFLHPRPDLQLGMQALTFALFLPIYGVMAVLFSLLIFLPSMALQTGLVALATRWLGARGIWVALLILPLTAIISQVCFQFMAGGFFESTGNDATVQVMGYFSQACFTVFSAVKLWLEVSGRPRRIRQLRLVFLLLVICLGILGRVVLGIT